MSAKQKMSICLSKNLGHIVSLEEAAKAFLDEHPEIMLQVEDEKTIVACVAKRMVQLLYENNINFKNALDNFSKPFADIFMHSKLMIDLSLTNYDSALYNFLEVNFCCFIISDALTFTNFMQKIGFKKCKKPKPYTRPQRRRKPDLLIDKTLN